MNATPAIGGIEITPLDPAGYRHTPWKNGGGVTIDIAESMRPGFAQRCGADCVANWNATIGPSLGLKMGQ